MIESHPEGHLSSTNYHPPTTIYHLSFINYHLSSMNKKELWQKILHFAITILTAIATTLGTTSCIGMMN